MNNEQNTHNEHSIVPVRLAITAMRDSGYKNAAYAIAELIDNAIQAGANRVELLCAEKVNLVQKRNRPQINQIAVLDNGCGMDASTLRRSLQFGNGTRLDDRTGIGRFGMGLPNSSISQARRVDVWTWQNGVDNALHTYIDIDEVEGDNLVDVPKVETKRLPSVWQSVGKSFDQQTGTLVVWSNLDRVMWKTAKAIIKNSEDLVGRMYRYFLNEDNIEIRLVAFDIDAPDGTIEDRLARPNDPMYLMEHTSCPAPFGDTPMFKQWGPDRIERIRFNGQEHEVTIRFSHAKEEAREIRDGRNPGDQTYGQHAKRNVGVSLVRARRELDLDSGWANNYEPTERWWGAEVIFPPSLDELFGVTNNKQYARNFASMADANIEELIQEYGNYFHAKEELSADEDPNLPLLEIAKIVNDNLSTIRGLLKAQTKGSRSNKQRHGEASAQARGTELTRRRIEEGIQGESDQQEAEKPSDVREKEIVTELTSVGATEDQAKQMAAKTVGSGLKYTFVDANITSSPAFFDVKPKGGSVIISLNTNHPAYDHFLELLLTDVDDIDEDELRLRLKKAHYGLELLLMAWARYEDESPVGKRRSMVSEARWDWGKMARYFLEDEDQ